MSSVSEGAIIRGRSQKIYLESWYKYSVTAENATEVFTKLLAEPDYVAFSLLKAKMIAQRHNFTDKFIAESIAPYYGPDGGFDQLHGDSFWGNGYQFRPGDKT